MGRNFVINDKNPPDDILEGLHKLRIRESEKLRTALELYDLETHQKKIRSKPTLAIVIFGQTDFGQTDFGQI